jgi:hypothetical protein
VWVSMPVDWLDDITLPVIGCRSFMPLVGAT